MEVRRDLRARRALVLGRISRHYEALAVEFSELALLDAEPDAIGALPFNARTNLPAGMKRKTFVSRCRALARKGDARVHREGRVWCARRDVFEAAAIMTADEPTTSAPYSLEAARARAGARRAGGRP